MSNSINIETDDSPIVTFIVAPKSSQCTLYINIDRPMQIEDAAISAIWLAPLRASSGNITSTHAIIAISEMIGIAEISGCGSLRSFSSFIF